MNLNDFLHMKHSPTFLSKFNMAFHGPVCDIWKVTTGVKMDTGIFSSVTKNAEVFFVINKHWKTN